MSTPPPGWYPAPDRPDAVRWWDGARWTDHVRPSTPEAPSTVLDLSHVDPGNREAAAQLHALKARGGFVGRLGGVMTTALGAQEVSPPRHVAEQGPAAQYPPSYAPTLPTTDAPGRPMLALGGGDGPGFVRTHDPRLHEFQVVVRGADGDDDLDDLTGPGGSLVMIGGGLLAFVVGLVAMIVGVSPLWCVLLQLGGVVLVGLGCRFLYVSLKQLGEGAVWSYRAVQQLRQIHAERSGTRS